MSKGRSEKDGPENLAQHVGALLDVWDQMPNDVTGLEELLPLEKKINNLREYMENVTEKDN